jgi:YgiT-type zinc finger domain-containing protein
MENLKQTLPCPFCEQGTSTLKQQETTLSYKETSFTVTDYFYRCDLCQEQFTTT